MTEYTISAFKCPVCGYITNNPVGRKSHEDLVCSRIKMDHHNLTYQVYSKYVTLVIDKHLTLDIFIK